jgi:membrane protein
MLDTIGFDSWRSRVAEKNARSEATRPADTPSARWRASIRGAKDHIGRDNVSLVAAGVAFYLFLAVFPAIAALVSLYGLLYDPVDIQRQMSNLAGLLPPAAVSLLEDQLVRMAGAEHTLGVGFALGIALAVWGASRGMKALSSALNITYGVTERRSYVRLNAAAFVVSFGAIVFVIVALGIIIAFPIALHALGLPELSAIERELFRWVPLGVFVMIGLALLYRYAPNRKEAKFRWVSWGSVAAALLWLLVSGIFSLYIAYFGNYNVTYGSLGAAIILMLWFYWSAYAVLLGGELNAAMERRSARNSTPESAHPVAEPRAQD